MALSNLDRVNKGLDLLRKGLLPFIEKEMKAEYKQYWDSEAIASFPEGHHSRNLTPEEWDVQAILAIMLKQWFKVFSKILGHQEKAWASELMEVRKRAAHQNNNNIFDTDDAFRALDNVERLLSAVAAPEAEEADHHKNELLRIRYEESARKKAKKIETQLVDIATTGSLKSWRQVITPHPDVASGKFQQAEFAADLWRVYQDGEAAGEYGRPIDFFNRTYLTLGIRKLLTNALQRLNNKGGDPVINLQTNFGGGKTHSLLALYHLCSGTDFSSVRDLEEYFRELGDMRPPKRVYKAVLVGNRIAPGIQHKKADGTIVNTLWGEMAWQLGGKEGYSIVKESDIIGMNPGDKLTELFKKFSPCIILIDEWVSYLRQLPDAEGMVCGTYDTHTTFAQALTEAAKTVNNALVVVSLPESDIEMGGSRGRTAAIEIGNIIGRTETAWSAATQEESFEIVTRRLFSKITTKEQFSDRDITARSFGDFYRNNSQEFPSETKEAKYESRIRDFYPIHPELFDILAKRWASIDRFQKTRGILRLMAKIINYLWENNDASPLILPANIPFDEPGIHEEMLRYLPDTWRAVVHSDVDGSNSLPRQIDSGNPNLGRYSATRRVARTLFFGSAPTFEAADRGLDLQRIKLGSIFPQESIAVFSDALRHLADKATYVYVQNNHYWYSDKNNVTRTAEERASHIRKEKIDEEIATHLSRILIPTRGQFSRIHSMPVTSGDVPDDMEMKLVVIGGDDPHIPRDINSAAYKKANEILTTKGTSQRLYRNTLIFLAPDKTRLEELKVAVRSYLAWSSIIKDKEILNLDAFQNTQAEGKVKSGLETIKLRLPETFVWILTPFQDLGSSEIQWDESKMNGSAQDTYNARVIKKLFTQSQLYNDFAATELRMNLDKVPLWRGNDVALKQLREDFAKYLYLPKLITPDLLRAAIESGVNLISWQKDTFAYAESFDEENKRYRGLRAGYHVGISLDGNGLVVNPEIAAAQFAIEKSEADEKAKAKDGHPTAPYQQSVETDPSGNIQDPDPNTLKNTRFFGHVETDATRFFRATDDIEKEILKHLNSIKGVNVKITIHIEAGNKEGFTPDTERTLRENGKTLGFGDVEFQ
jgi:predicted AAA+ superfamily ATPase